MLKYIKLLKCDGITQEIKLKPFTLFIDSFIPDIFKDIDNSFIHHKIFYLSSVRISNKSKKKKSLEFKCGEYGEYLFNYYLQNLKKLTFTNQTLEFIVSYWYKRIMESECNTHISKMNIVEQSVLKIIILGLSVKKKDTIIIENPELLLSPMQISKLVTFLVYLIQNDIQLIISTQYPDLVSKLRYCVYKNKKLENSIIIYNKINNKLKSIYINKRGKFVNKKGELQEFPKGFFDSILSELLEIN